MEQFSKECSVYANDSKDFVCISECGHVILSRVTYSKINLYDDTTSLDGKKPRSLQFYHNNILMTYNEFLLVNTAISVISFIYGFIVLLDDGSLLYIVEFLYLRYIIPINSKIKDHKIDYIESCNNNLYIFTFLSNNNLYIIPKLKIKLHAVPLMTSYHISNNILLTLNSKNYIEFYEISGCNIIPSKIGEYCQMDYIDSTFVANSSNTLSNLNIGNVISLNVMRCEIFVLLNNGKILCYSNKRPSKYVIKMLEMNDVHTIKILEDSIVCMSTHAILLIKDEVIKEYDGNHNVIQLVDNIYILNGKLIEIKNWYLSGVLTEHFFLSENNYEFLQTVSKFINVIKLEIYSYSTTYLLYLDNDNNLKIVGMMNGEHADLPAYVNLDGMNMPSDITSLQLKRFNVGSYI